MNNLKKFSSLSIVFLCFSTNAMQIRGFINPLEITEDDIIFYNHKRTEPRIKEMLYIPQHNSQPINNSVVGFPDDSRIRIAVQSEYLTDFKYSLTNLYAQKLKNLIDGRKLNTSSPLQFRKDTKNKIINTCFLNSLFSINLYTKGILETIKAGEVPFVRGLEDILKSGNEKEFFATTGTFVSQLIERLEQETQYYNEEEHENYKKIVISGFSNLEVVFKTTPEIKAEEKKIEISQPSIQGQEEYKKYGIIFTQDEKNNSSAITILDTELNQFDALNENEQNQEIFDQMIKDCIVQSENLPSFSLKTKSEETKKLWNKRIIIAKINALFHQDVKIKDFKFINLCQNINNSLLTRSLHKNDTKKIEEYAQNLIKKYIGQSEFQNKIKEINKRIPNLNLVPKKSYFYHWLIGGSIGIAALLGFLHKKNVINIPFFNRIPYLKK